MKYISGYVWQGNCNLPSQDALLLQQVRYGKCPILFSCICGGNQIGGYVTEQLMQWFYGEGISLCRERKSDKRIEKELCAIWERIDRETWEFCVSKNREREMQITGVLMVGNRFWLFGNGTGRVYVLNRRFMHSNIRQIAEVGKTSDSPSVISGRLQTGIGILLCDNKFAGSLTKEAIGECLAVQEIEESGQINRRLAEMQAEGEGRGSGLYLVCKEFLRRQSTPPKKC